MLMRYLVLATVAVSLFAYRAPLRQGEGAGGSLTKESLGELGAAGKWIQSSLRDQLVGKRVHFVRGVKSWSGKVLTVEVLPFSTEDKVQRPIKVTVETMAGMGDKAWGGVHSNRAVISLDQISGFAVTEHPYVGKTIKVSYDDPDDPIILIAPASPGAMFVMGYPNTITAVYNDGYVEVDVTGMAVGSGNSIAIAMASGTVFIHQEDILHDENLEIFSRQQLE